MTKTRNRKSALIVGLSVLTAALLISGTFAWQSVSQMALNENKASVNPGARLHDDYTGNYAKNSTKTVNDVGIKRVYVENFTNEEEKVAIIARVRLDEYMEIGASAGYKSTTVTAYGNMVTSKLNNDGTVNGVLQVTEDVDSGNVTLKVTPVPYTDYTVKSFTVDGVVQSLTNGVYIHTAQPITDGKITNPVTIEVEFEADNGIAYAYDTIEPAKSLVETTANSKKVTINDVSTWTTYAPKVNTSTGALEDDTASAFRKYVTLNFGWDSKYDTTGVYYMPTFNKDKDSLKADINGTYAAGFSDYVDYADSKNQSVTAKAKYDNDYDDVDNGNVYEVEETHQAQSLDQEKSNVISMQEWLTTYNMMPGDYWVYDMDGWAYWANLLAPEDVTGLLLSRNEMTGTPEDNWYYGMNVVGQFVTSKDIGDDQNAVGFFAANAGKTPSADAKKLLGVLEKLNDAVPVSLESGEKIEVTYLKNEATPLFATALTSDGTWIVSDENVLELSEDNEQNQVFITGKTPGEAIIAYTARDGSMALTKITVGYATYTINSVADGEAKGLFIYDDGVAKKELRVKGYYTEGDVYYQVAIGAGLFEHNRTLTKLTMEAGVRRVEATAFLDCNRLTGILEIPGTMEYMGDSAFSFLYEIDGIKLNEGMLKIGPDCFRNCSKVTGTIKIPSSVTSVASGAFHSTPISAFEVAEGNKFYCAIDGVLYSSDMKKLMGYPTAKEGSTFQIPEGVEKIGSNLFRGNQNLVTIDLPDTLLEIGSMAFSECVKLENAKIPANVKEIGLAIFNGSTKMTEIQLAQENTNYQVVDGILYDKDMLSVISCPGGKSGQIVISDGVTLLNKYAFWQCKQFSSVVIPKSLVTISAYAFSNTSGLTTIYYKGTEAQWNASSFKDMDCFNGKTIEFDYVPES